MFSLYYANFGEDILVKSIPNADNLLAVKRSLYCLNDSDSRWSFQPVLPLRNITAWQAIAKLAYASSKEIWVYMGCAPCQYHLYLRIHGDHALKIPRPHFSQVIYV